MSTKCPCADCTDYRAHIATIKAMKNEWPAPVFDWDELAAADAKVRERERQGKGTPENPPGSHPSHWKKENP